MPFPGRLCFPGLNPSPGSRKTCSRALGHHTVTVDAGPSPKRAPVTGWCRDPSPSSPQTPMSVSASLEPACRALATTSRAPSAASVPLASRCRTTTVSVSVSLGLCFPISKMGMPAGVVVRVEVYSAQHPTQLCTQ